MRRILTVVMALVLAVSAVGLAGCKKEEEKKDGGLGNAKEGKIVVGLDDTFAPMGFRDKKNKLVGFDIDLATEVAKQMKLEVEFKPIQWKAKDLELKSKKIDCIWNGMSVTPEREKAMSLSNKYLDNKIILMTSDNKVDIKIAKDLEKYNIGTQEDSAGLEMLKAQKNAKKFIKKVKEYPTYDDAISALKSGRVDVIAIDQVLGAYKNKNLEEKLAICKYALGQDAYAIGFRKEDTALRDKVNESIKALIDSGKAKEISKKWFGKNLVIFKKN